MTAGGRGPVSARPDGPNGNTGQIYSHNSDDPVGEPAVQSSVGDIGSPIDALIAVFLTNADRRAPTVVRDYSTESSRDVASTRVAPLGRGVRARPTAPPWVPPAIRRASLGVVSATRERHPLYRGSHHTVA